LSDEELPAAAVVDCIAGTKISNLSGVEVFDLYKGEGIPAGQKSIAVRVRYGALDRTLTDDEVTRYHQKVIDRLVAQLTVTIR